MVYISSVFYVVLLFVLTGLLILLIDIKGYRNKKLTKERKVARALGWLNLSVGTLAFVANWIYRQWFW